MLKVCLSTFPCIGLIKVKEEGMTGFSERDLDVVQGAPGRVAAVKVEHSCVSWGGGVRDWLVQE